VRLCDAPTKVGAVINIAKLYYRVDPVVRLCDAPTKVGAVINIAKLYYRVDIFFRLVYTLPIGMNKMKNKLKRRSP
jgi:hypothetical protein